jgi:lipopolysaccharide O-acetyltransferase
MKNLLATYGIFGVIQLMYFRIKTKLLFKNAKIIRFPFRIRGIKHVKVGANFTTGFNCRIDAFEFGENVQIEIGKNVQINDYVHIAAINSIVIGDNVLIASKVFITDHNHGNYSDANQDSPLSIPKERELFSKEVVIQNNVWIGEFVSILPGVTIGEGSIIGTMSVVNKDIPPYSIAIGSPAKVVKKYNFETKLWEKIKN